MSKQKVVEIVVDNNISFGQINSPADLMKIQEFAHQHAESMTKDFLIGAAAETAGCSRTLTGGTNVQIAAGKVYYDGYQFEAVQTNLTLAAGHASLPRLDYIVATIAGSVPSETQFLPFQRIRTSQELTGSTPPYPPTQFQRATEKRNIATIQVRQGTPAASPLPPSSIGSTDVVLFVVTVPANASVIGADDVADARLPINNLRELKQQLITIQTDNAALQAQIAGILETLLVLKYRYPTIVASENKCPAVAAGDNGTWVVDIPVGTYVQFGSRFVGITPSQFEDAALNARYADSSEAIDLQPIYSGETDYQGDIEIPPSADVVRFNVPASTKALYLTIEGDLVLRSTITPSSSEECILLKITPQGSSAPKIKRYVNARNGMVKYSGIYSAADPSTKQFENNIALPTGVGYFDIYRVDLPGGQRYQLPGPPSYDFDSIVTVPITNDGDEWHVVFYTLSGL